MFLGIENVDDMMKLFRGIIFQPLHDKNALNKKHFNSKSRSFCFPDTVDYDATLKNMLELR